MFRTRSILLTALSAVLAAGATAAMTLPAQAAPATADTAKPALTKADRAKIVRAAAKAAKSSKSIAASTPKAMSARAAAAPADVTPAHVGYAIGRVYGRGTDGRIWWRPAAGNAGWKPFADKVNSGPAALDATDETGTAVMLFARGASNQLVWNVQLDGAPDDIWLPLGGNLTSAPSAAVAGDGLYVTARGGDGAIWVRVFDYAADDWLPWRSLGGLSTSAASIVYHPGIGTLVTTRGTNGNVYQRRGDVSGSWVQLALPTISSRPEVNVAELPAGPKMSFAWRGADNALYLDDQQWGRRRAGGVLTSGATIYAWDEPAMPYFHVQAFARGTDNAMYHYDTDPSGGGRWIRLGGSFT